MEQELSELCTGPSEHRTMINYYYNYVIDKRPLIKIDTIQSVSIVLKGNILSITLVL